MVLRCARFERGSSAMRLKLKMYIVTFGLTDRFDNSDYPSDFQYFDKTNKKVIGKFQDEAASIPLTEFIGLRFKMYSYTKDNSKSDWTAKGIKKYVIKKQLKHQDYKNTLLDNNKCIIKWIQFVAATMNLEVVSLIKYHCLALMINATYTRMV